MMLETVREYALDRLAEDPRRQELHRRHLEHYLRVVEDCVPQLSRGNEDEPLALLDREIDNIRASRFHGRSPKRPRWRFGWRACSTSTG